MYERELAAAEGEVFDARPNPKNFIPQPSIRAAARGGVDSGRVEHHLALIHRADLALTAGAPRGVREGVAVRPDGPCVLPPQVNIEAKNLRTRRQVGHEDIRCHIVAVSQEKNHGKLMRNYKLQVTNYKLKVRRAARAVNNHFKIPCHAKAVRRRRKLPTSKRPAAPPHENGRSGMCLGKIPVINGLLTMGTGNKAERTHRTALEVFFVFDALGILVLPVVHGGGFLHGHGGGGSLVGHHERGHNGGSKDANHCCCFLWVGVVSGAASPRGDHHRRSLKQI